MGRGAGTPVPAAADPRSAADGAGPPARVRRDFPFRGLHQQAAGEDGEGEECRRHADGQGAAAIFPASTPSAAASPAAPTSSTTAPTPPTTAPAASATPSSATATATASAEAATAA